MNMLGKTIGEYQLVEVISQGENTVYKGFQATMNRYMAVKVLSPAQSADQAFVQQFQQDMRSLAALEHPNILPVYDYGQQDGLLYIASRYIEEGTLKTRLPEYRDLQSAAEMVGALTNALDFLHTRGITHGNLKPSNILIDADGRPLLTDMGFVQGVDFEGPEKVYLSPEQAQGGLIDRRTDVYALGGLLYTMLIGETPPLGAAPTPRLRRPDLPEGVEKVILKAMAPYPNQRYQTAGELNDALTTALASPPAPTPQPVYAQPAPPPPAPEPQKSGGQTVWIVVGVAILAVLIAAACVIFGLRRLGGGDDGEDNTNPTAVVPTPEPAVPAVTANRDATIYTGPGTDYDVIGVLRSGQSAEAIGRSADSRWWVISVLAASNGQGWVEDSKMSTTNTDNLPVIAAPPPPTPTTEAVEPQPPTAGIEGTTQANVGEEASFTGKSSQAAPGSQIQSYNWNFGDGSSAVGVDVRHIYNAPGVYQVELTVIADNGLSSVAAHRIEISDAAQLPSSTE